MNLRKSEKGIAHLGIILVVFVLAIIGFAGWRVYDKQSDKNENSSVANPATSDKSNKVDSEIKPGPGDEWKTYYNYKLGFSIKLPKDSVSSAGSKCEKIEKEYQSDDQEHPVTGAGLVPKIIFEDGSNFYFAEEYIYEVTDENNPTQNCKKVDINLSHLLEYEKFFASEEYSSGDANYEGVRIDYPVKFSVNAGIRNESDLSQWVNDEYEAKVVFKGLGKEVNKNGSKEILLDCKDPEDICIGGREELQYFEKEGKLFYMRLGNDAKFYGASYDIQYDDEVVDSFKLLN